MDEDDPADRDERQGREREQGGEAKTDWHDYDPVGRSR
jgi:hypothetical protein